MITNHLASAAAKGSRSRLQRGAVKRSISLPDILDSHAEVRARMRGHSGFSDYIQELIRRDGFVVAQ